MAMAQPAYVAARPISGDGSTYARWYGFGGPRAGGGYGGEEGTRGGRHDGNEAACDRCLRRRWRAQTGSPSQQEVPARAGALAGRARQAPGVDPPAGPAGGGRL